MKMEPLPPTPLSPVFGLLELLEDHGGREDAWKLARETRMPIDDLLPAIQAAELLGLVRSEGGDVELAPDGRRFLAADVNERKHLFRERLREVPLVRHLVGLLERTANREIDRAFVLEELGALLPQEDPEALLRTLVNWARYGELLGYSADREVLYLDRAD